MDDAKGRRVTSTLKDGALVVALERAGGSISYTQDEFQRVLAKWGGPARTKIAVKVLKDDASGESTIEVRLEERTPRNAELIS